jgi:hypothetical protein
VHGRDQHQRQHRGAVQWREIAVRHRPRHRRHALIAHRAAPGNLGITHGADTLGSLRQAIVDANATPAADTTAFAIPGSVVHTIAADPVAHDRPAADDRRLHATGRGAEHARRSQRRGDSHPARRSRGRRLPSGLVVCANQTTSRGLSITGFADAVQDGFETP